MATAHSNGTPSGDDPEFRVVAPLDEDTQHAATVVRWAMGLPPSISSVRAVTSAPLWSELFHIVRETKDTATRWILIDEWPRYQANRRDFDKDAYVAAIAAAKALVESQPDDPEPEPEERFPDYDLEEFLALDFRSEYLIDEVMVARQPCIIAAPSKSMKTSFAADAAVSLATGTAFLGRFETPRPARVLFISAESGGSKLQGTFLRILAQKGIVGEEARAQFRANLRTMLTIPRIVVPEEMELLRRKLVSFRPDVVFYDPLYKGLSGGSDPLDHGNLFQMGAALASINDLCESVGATLCLVHHFRKSTPNEDMPSLDHAAYAGISELARQWILLNRTEPYKPGSGYHKIRASIGGSENHQGDYLIEVNEGSKQDHGGEKWEVTVSNFDGSPMPGDNKTAQKTYEREVANQAGKDKALDDLAPRALAFITANPGCSQNEVRAALNVSGTKAGSLLTRMLERGQIAKEIVRKRGGDANLWHPKITDEPKPPEWFDEPQN